MTIIEANKLNSSIACLDEAMEAVAILKAFRRSEAGQSQIAKVDSKIEKLKERIKALR